jgi:hypothetical protein
MISLIISIIIILLMFSHCKSMLEVLISTAFIILFICLMRDWTLQEFFNNFTEMFNPLIQWLETQNIKAT